MGLNLESSGTPVYKLYGPLCFDHGDAGVHILGHDVPSVEHAAGHVFACGGEGKRLYANLEWEWERIFLKVFDGFIKTSAISKSPNNNPLVPDAHYSERQDKLDFSQYKLLEDNRWWTGRFLYFASQEQMINLRSLRDILKTKHFGYLDAVFAN